MSQIGRELDISHRRLEGLLCFSGGGSLVVDSQTLRRSWSELESCLTWHLEAVERYMLPLAERAHAAEVAQVRAAHARIRQLVSELELKLELQMATEPATRELVRVLRAYAARNTSALYLWVADHASAAVQYCILAMLGLAVPARASSRARSQASARSPNPPIVWENDWDARAS
jgi:hypothetical protein